MNYLRYLLSIFVVATASLAALGNGGCSNVPVAFDEFICDSTPFTSNPDCAKPIDAGMDAETDASNLKAPDDPGLPPAVFNPPPPPNACKSDCVPEPSGPTASEWPNDPVIAWFGPKSELKGKVCPPETLYEKVRGFDSLVAPPAKCDACACSANGTCTGLPSTIEIRSGKCGISNVEITPFDGPPSWDGSCTSVNAMAAGKLCNGVPCAQSVSASTLPGPVNESCLPMAEKPTAHLETHEWLDGALACQAKALDEACAITPEHCLPPLPDGWLRCVVRDGKHNECPGNYDDYAPRFVYQDNPIDDRGCSDCACGTPTDGMCIGSFRLYSDSSCITETNNNQIASTGPGCWDLFPPGLGLGSKTIVNLSYVPGTCSVTGGEPIGTVIPNDDGVRTICCRVPGSPPPPPLPPPPPY